MEISVKDLVCLVAERCILNITRTIVVRHPTPITETEHVRFTLPAGAQVGACLHQFTINPQAGDQIPVDIQLAPTGEAQDESVTISFSLPANCIGAEWHLRGRFFLINVTAYDLEMVLGRAVNTSSWTPGQFLKKAALTSETGVAVLRIDPLPATFVADLAVAFRFQGPALSTADIDGLLRDMLALNGQAKRRDEAFRGFKVITLLHFLVDLLPFMRALELRGLDPTKTLVLYKDYPYAHRELVHSTLEGRGYKVWGPVASAQDSRLVGRVCDFLSEGNEEVIIIEDGGYLAPAFHDNEKLKPHLTRIRGAVEQTTYGARAAEGVLRRMQERGEDARLAFPLISVARSEAKTLYEPVFVAEAACHNIVSKLAGASWIDAGVLLVGYGAIGSAIFSILKKGNARVAVYDPKPLRLLLARREGAQFVANSVSAGVAEFKKQRLSIDYVIGTTGNQSVSVHDAISMSAQWSPVLVSVSSKQVEFDIMGFERESKSKQAIVIDEHKVGTKYTFASGSIKLLGDGYPINFVSSESVPNDHIDPIMALLHVCAAELANPDVLRTKCGFVGETDPEYPGIPKSRLSHEVVQDIIERIDLFRPIMTMLVVPEN